MAPAKKKVVKSSTPEPENKGNPYLLAVIPVIGVIAAGVIAAYAALHKDGSPSPTPTPTGSSRSATATSSASPGVRSATPVTTTSPPNTGVTGPQHTEIADNHNGTKVFADASGSDGGFPDISFGTRVKVACFAANTSSMSSINGFYLIKTSPWENGYAPANTFANGDPLGGPGNTERDPKVPNCPEGTN
jgi:hypothetical protein